MKPFAVTIEKSLKGGENKMSDAKNAVFRERERALMREELAGEILSYQRNELYLSQRYLGAALMMLRPSPDGDIRVCGTDGRHLFYQPGDIVRLFRTDERLTRRVYMHTLLHCLFNHLFLKPPEDASLPDAALQKAPDPADALRDRAQPGASDAAAAWDEDAALALSLVLSSQEASRQALWEVSCDIAAEHLLDSLLLPLIHKSKSGFRQAFYEELRGSLPAVTAQAVYHYLAGLDDLPLRLPRLSQEFRVDDHSRWHSLSSQQQRSLENTWKDISQKMQVDMETFSKEASQAAESLSLHLRVQNRRKYNYRNFLQKFSTLREELTVDADSFDPIFYTYGLSLYENMPLVEPLETKEVRRIEEFVIVIDTSMSCKASLISRFLTETCSILFSKDSYFKKVNIHIIQCDEAVRKDTLIRSPDDIASYMEGFEIVGLGGTDFRPAFAYVNDLAARGSFTHLKGLLYFTDGYGIFPVKKPFYDTAFVFMRDDYRDIDVPPWAMKVILDAPGNVRTI